MINPQWLELPMSRTNFHGPKDVRTIEVRLYGKRSECSEVAKVIGVIPLAKILFNLLDKQGLGILHKSPRLNNNILHL